MVHCPFCQHGIAVKNAKPGRYQPKCPKCGKPFALVVNSSGRMAAAASLGQLKAKAAGPSPAATRPEGAPTQTGTTGPSHKVPPAADAAATLPGDPQRTKAPTETVASPRASAPRAPSAASEFDETAPGAGERMPVPEASPPPAGPSPAGELSGSLGGYEIVRLLGQGGMGSVYLARQLSLDRSVAVKTMNPQWANDPVFLSRFTREAYAAAQLTHHNVVQIYDIGEERQTHYFSMEFVNGRSLSQVVAAEGKLDPELAAGYVLQAARGLKFAHDNGMIHRDIKPEHLILNDQGIVKVADLGLVKTPGSDAQETLPREPLEGGSRGAGGRGTVGGTRLARSASVTRADVAMGTPAYMAPEQARDAAHVDARADIYSLGCTLYVLVTGRPPFEGRTVMEVMTKHATEPVKPPDLVVNRVPKNLSAIVLKMVAKDPAERYQTMDEVIAVLEEFLGVSSAGPFTPKEEHAQALESAVAAFNGSKIARIRQWLILGFAVVCLALVIGLAATNHPLWAGGILGLWVLTTACYLVLTGITQKTVLFRKFRQLVFGSSLLDWLKWTLGLIAFIAVLVIFNLHWVWLGFCIAALVLACAFHFTVDRMVAKDRSPHVQGIADMLKTMRLRGLEEDALRRFVCKYAGRRWEAFYEALFGYESKLLARQRWGAGDDGRPRKKQGAWRDGVIGWIEQKQKGRQEARQRKHLQRIEEKSLKAEGANEAEAKKKAQAAADTMVSRAAEFKETLQRAAARPETETVASAAGAATARKPPAAPPVAKVLYGDEDEHGVRRPQRIRRGGGILGLLLGARARFIAGAVLLAVSLLWMHQRGLVPGAGDDSTSATLGEQIDQAAEVEPLWVPGIPGEVSRVFSSHGAALAGLLLVVSAFFGGVKMTVLLVPAVALLLGGHAVPIPGIGPLTAPKLLLAAGGALGLVGLYFGRTRD